MFRINYSFFKIVDRPSNILKSLENVSGSLLTHAIAQTVATIIIIASGARNHIY